VSGACNAVTNSATLTVNTNTAATALGRLTNCPGASASFATIASGTGPFSLVWRKNGSAIANATNSGYTIASVTSADAANYSVEVRGVCGAVTNSATLTVNTNLAASALTNLTMCPGNSATFGTTPSGTGPFMFVWRKDGQAITNATNNSYSVAAVALADAGT